MCSSVEMALASVDKELMCWRAGVSTLSLRDMQMSLGFLQGAYLCPPPPGPTTSPVYQSASDLNH